MNRSFFTFVIFALCCLSLSCNPNRNYFSGEASTGGRISLRGAGSSFVAPLMQKWTAVYNTQNANSRVDYQSTGSGAGIQGVQEKTLDFGASDAPLTDEAQKKTPDLMHIPVALGAVVISYNLPELKEPLRLAPDVLADIFLGEITRWDDARIKADNPNAPLASQEISVAHRSDGSGTTDIFTDYLSKISPQWKQQVGRGTSVKWAAGTGGKGNEGVTGLIRNTPYTVGYIEYIYAKKNDLPVALLKNRSGNFIAPTLENVLVAAREQAAEAPEDLRISITDAVGANAYPLAGYTYVLAYRGQQGANAKVLAEFLTWSLHDGSMYAAQLQYAPLPGEIVKRAEEKIKQIVGN